MATISCGNCGRSRECEPLRSDNGRERQVRVGTSIEQRERERDEIVSFSPEMFTRSGFVCLPNDSRENDVSKVHASARARLQLD